MNRSSCHVALFLIVSFLSLAAADEAAVPNVVLGVHGGTAVRKSKMTAELEKHLRAGLEQALKAGYAVLKNPAATSLDAVEATIRVLEDDPWFNAGKGAVFTHDGRNELDASIMEGHTKKGGAVAGVTVVKNPISAARAVSCTGHGEFFIRYAVAHDISALIEYKELSIQKAADEVIRRKLKDAGGAGAAIALDPQGNFACRTTPRGCAGGMSRWMGRSPSCSTRNKHERRSHRVHSCV